MNNYRVLGKNAVTKVYETFEAPNDDIAKAEARTLVEPVFSATGYSPLEYTLWCGNDDANMRLVESATMHH